MTSERPLIRAKGWQGQALTMTSPVTEGSKDGYAANRFLCTVIAADTFSVGWQISKTAVFNWIAGDHLSCKRQGCLGKVDLFN